MPGVEEFDFAALDRSERPLVREPDALDLRGGEIDGRDCIVELLGDEEPLADDREPLGGPADGQAIPKDTLRLADRDLADSRHPHDQSTIGQLTRFGLTAGPLSDSP